MTKKLKSNRNSVIIYLAVILLPLLHSPISLDKHVPGKHLLLSLFVLFLSCFGYFELRKKKIGVTVFKKDTIFWFLLLFYLSISIIALTKSINIGDGLFELSKIILLLSLLFLITQIFDDFKAYTKTLSSAILTLTIVELTIGLIQLYLIYREGGSLNLKSIYRMSGSFAHKNIYTQFLLISLPFNAYIAFISGKKIKFLAVSVILLTIGIITMSLTRAVWIAGVFSVLICISIAFIKKKHLPFINLKKLVAIGGIAVVIIIASGMLYSKYDQSSPFKKQIQKTLQPTYGSSAYRLKLWSNTLKLIEEKPILGHGLANWKIIISKFGDEELESADNKIFYQRPHNDYLWIASEQGILALFSFIAVLLFLGVSALKSISSKNDKETNLFFLALIFYLTGFATYSFFSFPKDRIEHIVFFGFIVGAVLLKRREEFTKNQKKYYRIHKNSLLIISALTGFVLIISISRFNSDSHLKKAFEYRIKNNVTGMLAELAVAETSLYNIDPFSTPLSWYQGVGYFSLQNFKKAKTEFEIAFDQNPYHIHVINNLASTYEIEGKHTKALDLYRKAHGLSKAFPDPLFNISAIFFNFKDYDSAYYYLRKLNTQPNNEKYRLYTSKICRPIIEKIAKKTNESEIKDIFVRISSDENWLYDIHEKSMKNNISLDKQLLLDAIYILEQDSIKGKKEIEKLKNKYL